MAVTDVALLADSFLPILMPMQRPPWLVTTAFLSVVAPCITTGLVSSPRPSAPCPAGVQHCQVHTAHAGKDRLRVSWVSSSSSPVAASGVQWGPSSTNLTQYTLATSETYLLSDLCNATSCPYALARGLPDMCTKRWEAPGQLHHALLDLSLLDPEYQPLLYYAVGDAPVVANGSHSTAFGPLMLRPRHRGSAELSFVAFGDMGVGEVQRSIVTQLGTMSSELDFVLHVGDLAYANDGEVLWREWLQQIQPVAAVVPWLVGCGNHDCLYASQQYRPPWAGYFATGGDGGECGVPFNARFMMPGDVRWLPDGARETRNNTRNNIFWSIERGPLHVTMLSSEHDLRDGSTQWRWLQSDLAAVNRTRTPWLVVGLHRPLYSSVVGGNLLPEIRGMRNALESLLLAHKVDIVLNGHYHQYERTCRVARGACDERGPVHMTVGMAGPSNFLPWALEAPRWSRVRSLSHGHTVIDVMNTTHAYVQAVNATQGGLPLDAFWITRP